MGLECIAFVLHVSSKFIMSHSFHLDVWIKINLIGSLEYITMIAWRECIIWIISTLFESFFLFEFKYMFHSDVYVYYFLSVLLENITWVYNLSVLREEITYLSRLYITCRDNMN